jgi:hypothetical protein
MQAYFGVGEPRELVRVDVPEVALQALLVLSPFKTRVRLQVLSRRLGPREPSSR